MTKRTNDRPADGKGASMKKTTGFFLAGAAAELYLLAAYRYYARGSHTSLVAWYETYLPALMWAGLALVVLGVVLLSVGKGREKLALTGRIAACAGVFLAVTAPAIRMWSAAALTPLCVMVPAVMLLAFLWKVYDRECVYALAVFCGAMLVIWLCRRSLGNPMWAASARIVTAVFLALCGAAAALVRKAEAAGGRLKNLRILPARANYTVVYGALAISAALAAAAMLNVTVAYFALWAAAVCIFAVAVYCTVQQL